MPRNNAFGEHRRKVLQYNGLRIVTLIGDSFSRDSSNNADDRMAQHWGKKAHIHRIPIVLVSHALLRGMREDGATIR